MLTDEEIRKIAYYICEKRHKEEEVSDSTTFLFPIDIYVDILTKLSERYCIVPKSKVQDEYAEASNTYWQKYSEESQMDSRHDVYERGYNVGIMNVMEDIFGKDMFKEGKK